MYERCARKNKGGEKKESDSYTTSESFSVSMRYQNIIKARKSDNPGNYTNVTSGVWCLKRDVKMTLERCLRTSQRKDKCKVNVKWMSSATFESKTLLYWDVRCSMGWFVTKQLVSWDIIYKSTLHLRRGLDILSPKTMIVSLPICIVNFFSLGEFVAYLTALYSKCIIRSEITTQMKV